MYNDAVMTVIVKVAAAIFRDRVGDWDMLKRAKSPCGVVAGSEKLGL